MVILVMGLVLFLGVHSLAILGLRDRGVALLGEGLWKGLYSLLATAGLLAIVYGYGFARQEPQMLYVPPLWARHLVLLLMAPVFPLLMAAYLPGRIRALTGHPMLLGTTVWALAHLIANGMLADLLLFGGLLAWSVVERLSVERRPARPFAGAPPGRFNDAIAVVSGLVLYVASLLWLHRWLIGVPLV